MHTNWKCITIAPHWNPTLPLRRQSRQQQWGRKCEDNVLGADGSPTWRGLKQQLQKQQCIKVAQLLILKLNRFYCINTHIHHRHSGAKSLQPLSKTISIWALCLNTATNYSNSGNLRRAAWGPVAERRMNQLNAAIKVLIHFQREHCTDIELKLQNSWWIYKNNTMPFAPFEEGRGWTHCRR